MRVLQRSLAFLLALILLVPAAAVAAPAPNDLMPLRAVAEAAGATVDWDGDTWTATVTRAGLKLSVSIGESRAFVNGREIHLSQPVKLVDGRTMVPAALLMETALHQATWAPAMDQFAAMLGQTAPCPGMALGLSQDGAPRYLRGFGSRNCEENLAMTTATTMSIGSTTKSFTAVAIMQLQEQGKLNVSDPVQKYLPEYMTINPEWAAETTIHHLLTHSAGLPSMPLLYYAMAKSLQADPDAPPNMKGLPPIEHPEEMMAFIAEWPLPLIGEPGAYMSYSNEGYGLLGTIIARVSGQSYAAYVNEQILKPAGMIHSTFDHDTMLTYPEYATLYSLGLVPGSPTGVGPVATPVWWETEVMAASGFLRSTVQDMLRFSEIFLNEGKVDGVQLLTPESVKAMTEPYILADTGVYYGYGLMIRPDYYGMTVLEHGGSIKGAQTLFAMIPEQGLAAVGLTNIGGAPTNLAVMGALNLATGLPVTAPLVVREPYTAPADALPEYVGLFVGGEAAPMSFKVADGQLFFEQAGVTLPLAAVAKDEFVLNLGVELGIRFLRNDAGEIFAISVGYRVLLKQ